MERTTLQWSVLSLKALKEKAIHNRGPFLEKIEMSSPLGLHTLTGLTLSLLMILHQGPPWGLLHKSQDGFKGRMWPG